MTPQYKVRKLRKKREKDRIRQIHDARVRRRQAELEQEMRIQRIMDEIRNGIHDVPHLEHRRTWWRRIFPNKKEDS